VNRFSTRRVKGLAVRGAARCRNCH